MIKPIHLVLLLLLFFTLKSVALFEWMHSKKADDPTIALKDVKYLQDKAQDVKDVVKEKYEDAKDKVNEKYQKFVSDDGSIFNPIKKFFSPYYDDANEAQADHTKWLREALESASTFRTFPHEYILFVDVPGIPLTDLHVQLEGKRSRLHITGQYNTCVDEKDIASSVMEVCVERKVDKSFKVPDDIDGEKVSCGWRDGVVIVRLPRIEVVAKEVPVNPIKPQHHWFS